MDDTKEITFASGKTFLIRKGYTLHLYTGGTVKVAHQDRHELGNLMVIAVTR